MERRAFFVSTRGEWKMTALAYNTYSEDKFLESFLDGFISISKNRGMVATLDLSKIVYGHPKQFFWSLDRISKLIEIMERQQNGKKPYENVFISLNGYGIVNGKIQRKASHLAQIRNIGIDLDCYKLGITVEECKTKLQDLIERSKFPNPNFVVNSGNGVQLIYSIAGGAAPTAEMKWFVMYVTRKLTAQLVKLGADFQSCTLERVFRLPGTLNKKIGYPTNLVTYEKWNAREWPLNELADYVTPYTATKSAKKKSNSKLGVVTTMVGYKKGTRTLLQMNMARANDLLNLVHLRSGHIENRNILCYDYAFSLRLGSNLTRSEIQTAVAQMDAAFTSQQKRNVLRTTVKSACDDAEEFFRAYIENKSRMIGLDKNLVKPKKTATIIQQQSITEAEQEMLEVLFGKEEKLRRKYEKRRSEGMQTREAYLKECTEKSNSKLEQLRTLKAENPKASQRKLAEMMGISVGLINRLHKQL